MANRLPLVPPARTIAAVEAAKPKQIVETSDLHSCMASKIAMAALREPEHNKQRKGDEVTFRDF
jgi:hypothetical protein